MNIDGEVNITADEGERQKMRQSKACGRGTRQGNIRENSTEDRDA